MSLSKIAASEYKRCKACKTRKPLSAFCIKRQNKDGYENQCKDCRKKRPSMSVEALRAHNLKAKYGTTIDEYNQRLIDQEGKCVICDATSDTALVVDHEHETGEVRGLLCRSCNIGLGHFYDDIDKLQRAVDYLNEYTNIDRDSRSQAKR